MWSLVCAESILATRKLEENCVVHLPLHSCMKWLHGKWLFNHSMQCLTEHVSPVAFFCVAWHCLTEALCGMVSSISTTNLKKDTFFNAFIMKMSAVNWSWNTLVTCLLATNWIYLARKSKLYIKIINRLLCFCLLLSDAIYPLKLSILARLGWLSLTCLSESELLQVPESNFRPSK